MHSGTNVQLNPTQSDPQLAGVFGNKTEVFNKPDFPRRHDSTIDSSSNPNLRVSSTTNLYENVEFDKAYEKPIASQNKQTNNYSQVVSDLKIILKNRLPKPPPKPKEISKKHPDAFSPRKKSAVARYADNINGMSKSEICSTYHKLDDRPESDCTEMYVRKSKISFTLNTNENRDPNIYSSKSKTSDIYDNHNEKYDVSEVYENVEREQTNVPDDVKMSDMYGMSGYVSMEFKRRKSASELLNNDSKLMNTYATMHSIKQMDWRKLKQRTPNNPNTASCHMKGDRGCYYERMDSTYIYSINPHCETGNAPPFLKTKEKTDPLPCFCPKNGRGTQRQADKEIFFSCEDIYVNVCSKIECSAGGTIDADNADDPIFRDIVDSTLVEDDNISCYIEKFHNDNEDTDSDSRSSDSLFRKKILQLKRFLTDWT